VFGWLLVLPRFVPTPHARPPLVDTFPGPLWRTDQTVDSTLLLSDGRMRVESHTVRSESGQLLKNWIWMDVVDHVNVVPYVLAPALERESDESVYAFRQRADRYNKWKHGEFIVFKQRKYGLIGEHMAVAGGQVEMAKKELPLATAQRELAEELFLSGTDADWVELGSYRVNVNRGHGIVSCFLLADARPLSTQKDGLAAEFKVDELERQQVIRLSVADMQKAVRAHGVPNSGGFGEIKWQATAVMALEEIQRRIDEELQRIDAILPDPPGLVRKVQSPSSDTSPQETRPLRSKTEDRRERTSESIDIDTMIQTKPTPKQQHQKEHHPISQVVVPETEARPSRVTNRNAASTLKRAAGRTDSATDQTERKSIPKAPLKPQQVEDATDEES
jgi:hypothetical protein